jgi:hypothetical protein
LTFGWGGRNKKFIKLVIHPKLWSRHSLIVLALIFTAVSTLADEIRYAVATMPGPALECPHINDKGQVAICLRLNMGCLLGCISQWEAVRLWVQANSGYPTMEC